MIIIPFLFIFWNKLITYHDSSRKLLGGNNITIYQMGNTVDKPQITLEDQQFLSEQRTVLKQLQEEASCTNISPASAFYHRLLMNNIDVELLEEDVNSFLMFDHTLHNELGCLVDALVHRYTEELLHDRVRTSITTPKMISNGKNSIFTSGLRGSENLFVVKTDVVTHLECLYEYVIGKLVINPLRAEVPNFMYTYGYHECGDYQTKEGKMIRWCNSDIPDRGYLYLEKVNGITLDEFLKQHREETPEFAEVMLQLINALYIADAQYGFRHNDLHGQNIIVRELEEAINIPFTVLGQTQFIHSRWIPQIIDFGVSTAVYKGKALISPSYYNRLGARAEKFPYDLDRLFDEVFFMEIGELSINIVDYGNTDEMKKSRTTASSIEDRDKPTIIHVLIDRLQAHAKEHPDQHTFYHIASIFVDVFGGECIHDEEIVAPSLPFSYIDTTYRFYQRYFLVRPYYLSEYYDLINIIDKYHLSDLRRWIRTPTSTDVVEVTKSIFTRVEELVRTNPKSIIEKIEDKPEIGLIKRIDIINEVADYVYVLRSYCRMVLPLARTYRLISTAEERYVREVTETLSNVYEELVREAHRLYPLTERFLRREGYTRSQYRDDMEEIAFNLVFVPDINDM